MFGTRAADYFSYRYVHSGAHPSRSPAGQDAGEKIALCPAARVAGAVPDRLESRATKAQRCACLCYKSRDKEQAECNLQGLYKFKLLGPPR